MNEEHIAALLSQRVPTAEPDVAPQSAPQSEAQDTTGAQKLPPTELDEYTMFKMHDFFGEQYKGSNVQNQAKLQFIYDNISSQLGTRDYVAVLSRISELERMIGSAHSENRIAKLYNWVGLDNVRRKAEAAMRLVNG